MTSYGTPKNRIPKIVDARWFKKHNCFPYWMLNDHELLSHKKQKENELDDLLVVHNTGGLRMSEGENGSEH